MIRRATIDPDAGKVLVEAVAVLADALLSALNEEPELARMRALEVNKAIQAIMQGRAKQWKWFR